MKLKKYCAVLCALSMLLCLSQTGVAAEANSVFEGVDNFFKTITFSDFRTQVNEDYGVKVSPYYNQIYKVTDNVFGAPDGNNEHSENIFTFQPGVRIVHKGEYGNAGVNYNASLRYYGKYGEQNEQDNFFTSWINYKPNDDYFISVSETLNQQSSTASISQAEPTNFLDNTLVVIGGYNGENTNYSLGYRMFDRDFSTVGAKHFNYNEDIYSVTADHDLAAYSEYLEGFRGQASLRLGNVEYSHSSTRDAFWIEVPVGIRGKLPMDVHLDATLGIYGRNQENPHRNDTHWITANLALSKVFNNKTKVEASFRRFPQEATFGGAAVSDNKRWALDVKHLVNQKVRVRGNVSVTNMDIEQSSFTGQRAFVNGFLIVIPSNRVKRDDDTFALNLGSDIKVSETTRLHLDYDLVRRNSNISALDMTENSLTLRASVAV